MTERSEVTLERLNNMPFVVEGIVPALVTPFDTDFSLNEVALRQLIRFVLKAGVHGIFVCGNAGEFYALSNEEKKRVFEIALEEAGEKVAVYAGTGAITTEESLKLTEMAGSVGIQAVSIITPYFVSLSEAEMLDHYKRIALRSRIPIIVYNNPARAHNAISARLAVRLAGLGNIIGMKESSGDISLTAEIIRSAPPDFKVLVGRDNLIYPSLVCGCAGAITSCANHAPQLAMDIYNLYKQGDHANALAAQHRFAALREAFRLGSFPSVIKEALQLLGIPAGPPRPPVQPLCERGRNELRALLSEAGLI